MKTASGRVLLVMINHHVGNFVVSLPFLETLAAHFGPEVDVVVDSRFASLARLLPSIRNVVPYVQHDRRGSKLGQLRNFLDLFRSIRRGRYSLVVDVGGGIQSVTIATLAFAKKRVGLLKSRRSWLYTERLPPTDGVHASDRFMPFMKWIGHAGKPEITLRATEPARERIRAFLGNAKNRPIAVVHAGAGYEFRQWPLERFAATADELVRRWGARVIFIGAPGEENFLEKGIGLMKQSQHARSLITDLDAVVALFERAAILVSNESGPTHLAAATNVPIVTIFGPSKEASWRPCREKGVTILRGQVCAPECRWGRCRVGLPCILKVSVDNVVNAAAPYLDRSAASL